MKKKNPQRKKIFMTWCQHFGMKNWWEYRNDKMYDVANLFRKIVDK